MAHAQHYRIMSSYFTQWTERLSTLTLAQEERSVKILGKESFQPPITRRH